MFLNSNEQLLNVPFKVRHGEGLYAGFASTDSLRCFEGIWGFVKKVHLEAFFCNPGKFVRSVQHNRHDGHDVLSLRKHFRLRK